MSLKLLTSGAIDYVDGMFFFIDCNVMVGGPPLIVVAILTLRMIMLVCILVKLKITSSID